MTFMETFNMETFQWVIAKKLACGCRPGYSGGRSVLVQQPDVDVWISEAKAFGIASIICLLADDQLCLYAGLPEGLVSYYRAAGFAVEHVPARDGQSPPLSKSDLAKVWNAYRALAKPVLVHCSAGVGRTGRAVEHIQRQLTSRGV